MGASVCGVMAICSVPTKWASLGVRIVLRKSGGWHDRKVALGQSEYSMYHIGEYQQAVDVLGTDRKSGKQQHQLKHSSWSCVMYTLDLL